MYSIFAYIGVVEKELDGDIYTPQRGYYFCPEKGGSSAANDGRLLKLKPSMQQVED